MKYFFGINMVGSLALFATALLRDYSPGIIAGTVVVFMFASIATVVFVELNP